jgi:hypothetical protein
MSRDLTDAIRSTSPALVLLNLPADITDEEHAAQFLWEKLHINIDPAYMSIRENRCMVLVTRFALANCWAELLKPLRCEAAYGRKDHPATKLGKSQ